MSKLSKTVCGKLPLGRTSPMNPSEMYSIDPEKGKQNNFNLAGKAGLNSINVLLIALAKN